MIEATSSKDIERRKRLQEWFKSDPDIWQDLIEEGRIAHHNEMTQLKARTCTNREWSSGYIAGQEFLLGMEKYLVKEWIPLSPQQK